MRAGGNDSCRFEQRLVRKDGSVVWVVTTLGCVRTGTGAPARMVLSAFIARFSSVFARLRSHAVVAGFVESVEIATNCGA
jgi:hypothetical protein